MYKRQGDLRRADTEITKIMAYMYADEQIVTEELVDKLVYSDPRGNIFNLVDALGEGIPAQSFHCLLYTSLPSPWSCFFLPYGP